MSDDIEKQKLKRVADITDRVVDGYSNELNKNNHNRLTKRKHKLQDYLAAGDSDEITLGNYRLQLQELELSLKELDATIDWDLNYDTSVEEADARRFLAESDVLLEGQEMITQNDVLDKLENELYNKK